MRGIKHTISILLAMLLIFIMATSAYAQTESIGTTESNVLKEYDPLLVIQKADNCKIEKKSAHKTIVTLSDGTKTVYEKMDADHKGIKYNVTEGELKATLEITKDNDIYINNKLVEYNEGIVEIPEASIADNHEESDNTRAGGWVKWTTTPIWGTASDYTKNIKNVKMGNIVLKTALMELPLAVALSAIAAPLGIAVSIGTGFISITKSIYSAANLDPKKMWYNERINKYKNSNNATQYRTQWVKSDGTPVKSGKYQYGYCTIG